MQMRRTSEEQFYSENSQRFWHREATLPSCCVQWIRGRRLVAGLPAQPAASQQGKARVPRAPRQHCPRAASSGPL